MKESARGYAVLLPREGASEHFALNGLGTPAIYWKRKYASHFKNEMILHGYKGARVVKVRWQVEVIEQ